jgi:septal ring factor EnvC (AmiA/AmiB activator)
MNAMSPVDVLQTRLGYIQNDIADAENQLKFSTEETARLEARISSCKKAVREFQRAIKVLKL